MEAFFFRPVVEKKQVEGQQENNQDDRQNDKSIPPSHLGYGEFNEYTVNKTKAATHLAEPQDQPFPFGKPIHQGWRHNRPSAEGASQRHKTAKKEIEVPQLIGESTASRGQPKDHNAQGHHSPGLPAVGKSAGNRG
jgi:hypothetical protein